LNLEQASRFEQVLAAHAERTPEAIALEGPRGALTYRALFDAVEKTAAVLRAQGVEPGDRVVLVAENSPELVIAFLAVLHCRACAVNASGRLATPEITRIVEHAQPRLVVFIDIDSAETQSHADAMGASARLEADAGAWRFIVRRPGEEAQAAARAVGDGLATFIYTSGTTGTPKSAMLTHANLLWVARTLSRERRYTPSDKAYCVSPLSHVGGLAASLCTVLYAGATVLLPRRFSPADLADAIDRRQLTVVPGVPPLFVKFIEWARANGWRPPAGQVRMISSSAGFFDPGVKRELEALFGLPLVNAYALTESTAAACQTPFGTSCEASTSGRPLPGVELRLADVVTDQPVTDGEPGEVQLRGPNIFAGYFRDEAATRAAFSADGWYKTGDLGRLDAQGFLHLMSRLKDVIKRSGFNVYPADIEMLLNEHPAVVISAVIGRKAGFDEEIVAFVQARPGEALGPEAVRDWLEGRLASYKRPGRIVCLPELPTLNNGKVDKLALARHLPQIESNA
jgi:acyl-CoA synthetase (AMP-forming)/AMP-acid ligase II